MTKKSDLKALVRERMAKTRESYTTALRAVQAQKADWFDGSEEKLPCGHGVKRPDRAVLTELKLLHGLDAEKELRAAYEHERQHHLKHLCSVFSAALLRRLAEREEKPSTKDLCAEFPDNRPETVEARLQSLLEQGLVSRTPSGLWDVVPAHATYAAFETFQQNRFAFPVRIDARLHVSPPVRNGVCVYCGRMPHWFQSSKDSCDCPADPPDTKYARCTNCDLSYKIHASRSRRCERCLHTPVEIVDMVERCSNASSVSDSRCVFVEGHKEPCRYETHKHPRLDRDVNGRLRREPTADELGNEATCSCGGAARLGPGASIQADDPDCLFHHPLTSADAARDEVQIVVNGVQASAPTYLSYFQLLKLGGFDPTRTLSVTFKGKLLAPCDDCDPQHPGRWFDASHSAYRTCERCRGSGRRVTEERQGILGPKNVVEVLPGMVFNVADTSGA